MRVVHVTPYFAPAFRYGGPPQSILGLCRGLLTAGVDIEVLTTDANGDDALSEDVVNGAELDGVPVRYLTRSFPRRYFNAEGLRVALRERVARADVVHVHGLWSFPVWTAVGECRRADVPFVVSPRGMLDTGSFGHHRWRKEVAFWSHERRYLREAALLHATSESERRNLDRLALGPELVHIPNGVSPPESSPTRSFRRKLGIAEDAVLVVFLGRLHPIKRIDLLVEAMGCVHARGVDAHLLLAGPEDGLDARALVAGAAPAGAVSWVGAVAPDEKWGLLAEANVVVSCSNSESFGMSIVEAMAMGTPVVTTKTCPWEEVERACAGYWVEQTAPEIANAIVELASSPIRAREMGERGRRLVGERYRWPAIGRAMSAHYERVAS